MQLHGSWMQSDPRFVKRHVDHVAGESTADEPICCLSNYTEYSRSLAAGVAWRKRGPKRGCRVTTP